MNTNNSTMIYNELNMSYPLIGYLRDAAKEWHAGNHDGVETMRQWIAKEHSNDGIAADFEFYLPRAINTLRGGN